MATRSLFQSTKTFVSEITGRIRAWKQTYSCSEELPLAIQIGQCLLLVGLNGNFAIFAVGWWSMKRGATCSYSPCPDLWTRMPVVSIRGQWNRKKGCHSTTPYFHALEKKQIWDLTIVVLNAAIASTNGPDRLASQPGKGGLGCDVPSGTFVLAFLLQVR